MKKGTVVLVTKSVYTKEAVGKQLHVGETERVRNVKTRKNEWSWRARHLTRITHKKPFMGLVVGWSTRISGIHWPGESLGGFESNEYSPGEIRDAQTHKVIMVQPLDTERWNKPIPCLEIDLEIINPDL